MDVSTAAGTRLLIKDGVRPQQNKDEMYVGPFNARLRRCADEFIGALESPRKPSDFDI